MADGEEGWIEKVVAGGGKERAPVRVTEAVEARGAMSDMLISMSCKVR